MLWIICWHSCLSGFFSIPVGYFVLNPEFEDTLSHNNVNVGKNNDNSNIDGNTNNNLDGYKGEKSLIKQKEAVAEERRQLQQRPDSIATMMTTTFSNIYSILNNLLFGIVLGLFSSKWLKLSIILSTKQISISWKGLFSKLKIIELLNVLTI
jgi:hypothetical protein